ncbi:tetratricopeptide repeat protein [Selenomonas sp.]|uniref:tetratricopeptide repeat protein n=1 Tax=Selenomonas sp. TaxID=2053611 RepID=UPI0025DA1581|nr:tetratricopeptide repeat protein [Selenomonas sp.]MCI6283619.1 glucosaminidase domain-containing protein [Selenomonas sp.]
MKPCLLLPLAAAVVAPWLFAAPAAAAPSEIAERPIAGSVTIARPDFGKTLPGEVNKKAIENVAWRLTPAYDELLLPEETAPETVTIFGSAEATPEQMAAYITRRNPAPKLNCTVPQIVRYYYEEAGREGIRPDIALCQALKETGFFAYGGDVVPAQNNFCGLGTTGGGVRGASFATPQLGVRAHIQHLLAYASTNPPHVTVVDPRYDLIVHERPDIHGSVTTWTGLNGIWAVPGKTYGQDILRLWSAAKAPDASDAALAAAEKNVRQAPDEAYAYLYRGIVYAKRGDTAKARADFETGATYDTSGTALYDLAILLTQAGDTKAAARAYDNLLDAHPAFSAAAWYNRGLLHLANKKPKDAEAAFYHALNCNPQGAAAQNAIAVAKLQQKDYKGAWTALETAAQINNTDLDVLANQIVFAACVKEK